MPKLSDSMADAVIVRWLKSPGDAFARGEALIEVETDRQMVAAHLRHLILPLVPERRIPVEEQHERALPDARVVQAHPVG